MKTKAVITALIAIMLMSMTASAYVPPELRTGTQMSELEIIKLALKVHDESNDWSNTYDIKPGMIYVPITAPRWANDIISDAEIHLTNSGRGLNNHAQLRQWVAKVESQKPPGKKYSWIEPPMDGGWQGPGSN